MHSKLAWAALAFYRKIYIFLQPKRQEPKRQAPLLMGPILKLLGNISGTSKKQYLPASRCCEDVELAANWMHAYWVRILDSVDQTAVGFSLAVPSPPVMCWICGEGFLHNGTLFNHCCAQHSDCAAYRKTFLLESAITSACSTLSLSFCSLSCSNSFLKELIE